MAKSERLNRKQVISQRQLPARPIKTGVYAKSPSVLQARSRKVYQMMRRMTREMPELERRDRYALRAFCEFEYLAAAVWNQLDKGKALFDAEGNVRRLAHDYRQIRQSQMVLMRELGMTPVARAALGVGGNRSLDLVGEFARDIQREKQAEKR